MAKSRRKTYKSRKVQVDLAELQTIVEATSERPLTEQEQKKLLQPHISANNDMNAYMTHWFECTYVASKKSHIRAKIILMTHTSVL